MKISTMIEYEDMLTSLKSVCVKSEVCKKEKGRSRLVGEKRKSSFKVYSQNETYVGPENSIGQKESRCLSETSFL